MDFDGILTNKKPIINAADNKCLMFYLILGGNEGLKFHVNCQQTIYMK